MAIPAVPVPLARAYMVSRVWEVAEEEEVLAKDRMPE